MGLLKSIDDVPGIDYYEYRDSDYYNKYLYRARFNIVGVRYTWYVKDPQEFEDRLLKGKGFYSLKPKDKVEIVNVLPTLRAFIEWRVKHRQLKTCTIRVEHNSVSVFSNDLSFLQGIEKDVPGIKVDYTEVQKAQFVGVKHFVHQPKHKYRVYLKSKRIEQELVKQLKDSISRTKGLYPSSALKFWANNASSNQSHWRYRFSSASHFIDYDDESTLSYLALLHGELLGKRYKLEKRPDTE